MWIKFRKKTTTLVSIKQPIVKNVNWLNSFFRHKLNLNSLKRINLLNFFLLVIVCWAIFQVVRISAIANNLKEQILKKVAVVTTQFSQKDKALNFNQLSTDLQTIEETLNEIDQINNSIANTTLNLSRLTADSKNLKKLSKLGLLLTDSGKKIINLKELFSKLTFKSYGVSGIENIKFLQSELLALEDNLVQINQIINHNKWSGLEPGYVAKLQSLAKILDQSIIKIGPINQFAQLGDQLLEGRNNYLILLQNQNELRPTGGFIGSFANFHINRGSIEKIQLTSIYDLDGQLIEKITPPEPLLAVNDRWYLRDANWFVDFEQSAKKITEFFEKEGGETPDFIIAITPKIISDLIALVGPIKLETGLELNSENLVEQLQFLTQQNLLAVKNEPKQILSTLMDKLFYEIEQLPGDQKTQLPKILFENLQAKQILAFAKNPKTQKIFNDFNWSGKIHNTSKDFLFVNISNLNGSKTDLFINQGLDLVSNFSPQGKITNTLTIKRINTLPEGKDTTSLVYARILVPKGSKFIEAVGFKNLDLPKLSLNEYKPDEDVKTWEKKLLRDVTTGTTIGEEADKTFFANWIEVKPGSESSVKLTYELPFKLSALNAYSIIFQKQPGTTNQTVTHKLVYENKQVLWHNLTNPLIEDNILSYNTVLNKDLIFGILLKDNDK
jgi:hypothetical protein